MRFENAVQQLKPLEVSELQINILRFLQIIKKYTLF
jgi:hypothetical protein